MPQHVLRFWESRFAQIKPMKRAGGRRYYRPDDVDLLRGIHHLLYGEGYTIRGVQRILRDQGIKFVQTVWQAGAAQPSPMPEDELEDASDEVAQEEAVDRPVGRPLQAQVSTGQNVGLTRDDLRRLQVTLFELGECRRLLDEVMKQQ